MDPQESTYFPWVKDTLKPSVGFCNKLFTNAT